MMDVCPNCGKFYFQKPEDCPNCGYNFSMRRVITQEEKEKIKEEEANAKRRDEEEKKRLEEEENRRLVEEAKRKREEQEKQWKEEERKRIEEVKRKAHLEELRVNASRYNAYYEYKTEIVHDMMGMFPKEEFDKVLFSYAEKGWRLCFVFTNDLNRTMLGDQRQERILVFERCIKPAEFPTE